MDAATARKQTKIPLDGLKKVSSIEGGEYAGPCPWCGGKDRYRVQPHHPDGPRWYCRGCGENKWHDAIDYVMRRDDVDFQAALEILSGEKSIQQKLREKKQVQENQAAEIDREKWGHAARAFIRESIEKLWSPEGLQAMEYLHGRGLKDFTIASWWLGYNDLEGFANPAEWGLPPGRPMKLYGGIVIPCIDRAPGAAYNEVHYVKVRRNSGEPRYINLTGSKAWLFGAQGLLESEIGFLFESELDVILAYQTGFKLGYCSMPANDGATLRPEWQPFFNGVADFVVAMDNDDPGERAAASLCKLPHFWKVPCLPVGKDLTEYSQAGGDVFEYLYDAVGVINGHR